jgi:hypothetical protein
VIKTIGFAEFDNFQVGTKGDILQLLEGGYQITYEIST